MSQVVESSRNWKRMSLLATAVSVGLSALLGVGALLTGNFGDVQLRVLFTTLTTSGASICALACLTLWERRAQKYPALPGVVLAILGAILVSTGIWLEIGGEEFWKTSVTVVIFAVATAHISLLATAKLEDRYSWSLPLAHVLVYVPATTLTLLMWAESSNTSSYRLIGTLSILTAAISIAIPIFQKLSTIPESPLPNRAATGHPIKMLCPNCGAELLHPLGLVTCTQCGTNFELNLQP